jgi:hypothetical protein
MMFLVGQAILPAAPFQAAHSHFEERSPDKESRPKESQP